MASSKSSPVAPDDPGLLTLLHDETDPTLGSAGHLRDRRDRRHLDTGQRAFVALRIEEHYAELGKKRRAEAASRDQTLPNPSRSDAEGTSSRGSGGEPGTSDSVSAPDAARVSPGSPLSLHVETLQASCRAGKSKEVQ
jgi:hypothetical protein